MYPFILYIYIIFKLNSIKMPHLCRVQKVLKLIWKPLKQQVDTFDIENLKTKKT